MKITETSFESLKNEGFDDDIIGALKLLTHEDSVDYMEYVGKIALNPLARKVKMANLKHNMDSRRTGGKVFHKADLYKEAYAYLEKYENL